MTGTSLPVPDARRDGPPTTLWVLAGAVASAAAVLLIGVVGERFASSASMARAAMASPPAAATSTPSGAIAAPPAGSAARRGASQSALAGGAGTVPADRTPSSPDGR